MQEYNQNDMLSLSQLAMGQQIFKFTFQYSPKKEDARAALNFHLTKSEKQDIAEALESENNQYAFHRLIKLTDTISQPSLTKRE
jgi:hypothetical protein